jgi:hypothetical protein
LPTERTVANAVREQDPDTYPAEKSMFMTTELVVTPETEMLVPTGNALAVAVPLAVSTAPSPATVAAVPIVIRANRLLTFRICHLCISTPVLG